MTMFTVRATNRAILPVLWRTPGPRLAVGGVAMAPLPVWIGPLSMTSTSGRVRVAVPYTASRWARNAMNSALRFFGEVETTSRFVAWSSAPNTARRFAWPGACTSKSSLRLAQVRARYGCVEHSLSS